MPRPLRPMNWIFRRFCGGRIKSYLLGIWLLRSNSRFPAGMEERKASATTEAEWMIW